MADNRKPTQRYLSGRVKIAGTEALSSDRHLYVDPGQVEPNLGYVGEKPIPLSDKYYQLVTINNGTTYDRYWTDLPPVTLANGITIFDEGTLVGTANSVSRINFVGPAITATASGTISTITVQVVAISSSPPVSANLGDLWWDSEYGDLNVYYEDDDSGQWVSASNRVGGFSGVGIGSTTINPESGYISNYIGTSFQDINIVGTGISIVGYGVTAVIDFSSLISGGANVSISTDPPNSPNSGDLWWDSDVGELYIYYSDDNSDQWVETSGGSETVTVSDTAPTGANSGDLWWNSASGVLNIYYNDGDSQQWIDATGGILDNLVNFWTLNSSGIHTIGNVGVGTTNPRYSLEIGAVGTSGTSLWVNGDARVTGILTVGPASITLNGITNEVFVGTGTTIYGNSGIVSCASVYADKFYRNGVEAIGPQGAQGVQGTVGAQGNQGVQGTVGAQGNQGRQGAQGSQGAQGNQGVQGTIGAQGAQGNQGVPGTSGTIGSQGAQGNQGVQGTIGAQGAQGNQGVPGTSGTIGSQGSQGVQGTVGAQGAQGVQGTNGTIGAQGAQGAQGSPGVQGAQGSPGAQGNQGVQGAQGSPGNLTLDNKSSNYTLVASDDSKIISITAAIDVTVPSGVFSAGDSVSIVNTTSASRSIVQGGSVTMYLAGTSSTGNRTLFQKGICTVVCISSNTFIISGAGLV